MAGERWCEYYFLKYGVDVRSLRYPGIISYKSPPGGGTTDYAIEIFHAAINNQVYKSFIRENVSLPMLYMNDAIQATVEIMNVNRKKLTVNSSYNISAMSFNPKELTKEIQRIFPDFRISYEIDFRNEIALSWPSIIDDSIARNDWKWNPAYNLRKTTLEMINGISK